METASSSSSYGGGGEKELGLLEVQAAASALRRSEVFHVVKELLGFVLYMHHQIPSVLQNLENEFESLKEEMAEMILPPAVLKPSDQRKYNTRKREVRCRIKKQEKLMNGISTLLSAFQQALDEVPSIEGVALILGGSLVRPLFVYDITISHGRFESGNAKEHALTKLAQSVSRKAIRALVSRGAGSLSYTGLSPSLLLYILARVAIGFNLTAFLLLSSRPQQAVSVGKMSQYIESTTGFPSKARFSLQQEGCTSSNAYKVQYSSPMLHFRIFSFRCYLVPVQAYNKRFTMQGVIGRVIWL